MAKPLNYSVIYIGRQSLSLRFSSKCHPEKQNRRAGATIRRTTPADLTDT